MVCEVEKTTSDDVVSTSKRKGRVNINEKGQKQMGNNLGYS